MTLSRLRRSAFAIDFGDGPWQPVRLAQLRGTAQQDSRLCIACLYVAAHMKSF